MIGRGGGREISCGQKEGRGDACKELKEKKREDLVMNRKKKERKARKGMWIAPERFSLVRNTNFSARSTSVALGGVVGGQRGDADFYKAL